MKTLLICMATAVLLAQNPVPAPPLNQYSFDDSFSASAGETLTFQLPASPARGWVGNWLTVSFTTSTAQARVCFLQGGTTASATRAAPTQLFGAPIPVTRIFTTSNASGATSTGCSTITGSGQWNLGNMFMAKGTTSLQQIHISVTPLTGTITGDITPLWIEQ